MTDDDYVMELPVSKLWRAVCIFHIEHNQSVGFAATEADEAVARYRATFNKPADEDKDW